MIKIASINRSLGLVLWTALLAGIVLMSCGERRVDLWWQLTDGLSILAAHHLPTAPIAAFGFPSQPFVDEYGLYEIVLALLYKIGGFAAIHVAFIGVYLLIFAVPLLTARGIRRDLVSLALLALAGIFMINRYEQRPELVGVLLLVLLIAHLRRTREFQFRALLPIALLFAVWTNVHSSYLIGLLALFVWLLDRTFFAEAAARWKPSHALLTLALACAAVLVNPYGWHRIVFTFAQENDLGSNLLSREMWPAWDQPADVQALLLATAVVLACALAFKPRPERWLAALALMLYVLALYHIRHMSFLAAALLCVVASRPATGPSANLAPLRALALAVCCIVVLIFDYLALNTSVADMVANENERNRAFAPDLLSKIPDGNAVLCHDAEGAFLSFTGTGRPLVDSGQGRFDDDTKRFYFFAVQDPQAFNEIIDGQLVTELLVTRPVMHWTVLLALDRNWRLAAASRNGLLFTRVRPESAGFNWDQKPVDQSGNERHVKQTALFAAESEARNNHDAVAEFCLSTLRDDPAKSLALLNETRVDEWSEPFFTFADQWINGSELRRFAAGQKELNPLLRELALAQDSEPSTLPPVGPTNLEKLARVMTLIERNDRQAAHDLLFSIPPPLISPLYYKLRDRLGDLGETRMRQSSFHIILDPDAFAPIVSSDMAPAELWQDWNAGGEGLLKRVTPQLRMRLSEPAETLAPQPAKTGP